MALAVCEHAFVFTEVRVTLEGEAADVARNLEVRKAHLGI